MAQPLPPPTPLLPISQNGSSITGWAGGEISSALQRGAFLDAISLDMGADLWHLILPLISDSWLHRIGVLN
jgi:hypothetical protein